MTLMTRPFWMLMLWLSLLGPLTAEAQDAPSIARVWNEALLGAIRTDLARPTVHARNLFHSSLAMYDLWAVFDDTATTWLLGQPQGGPACALEAGDQALFRNASDAATQRDTAISYAMFRLLLHRFSSSPGAPTGRFRNLMGSLGHDPDITDRDFSSGSGAALGNHMAHCIIEFGLVDGANESEDYANRIYSPVNPPINPAQPGTPGLTDPDRWQPLRLDRFVDQAGNPISSQPPFLSAEWGQVRPFALGADDRTAYERDGQAWWVYHDPGFTARLIGPNSHTDFYIWNHTLVTRWSAHLDPTDGLACDISPARIGNTTELPRTTAETRAFYDAVGDGCSVSDQGHRINPHTGQPYAPQVVPRGDYTRVLAEFWADGPDSETPPGHWFSVFNEAVSDHPALLRRYRGSGPELPPLEWDVKAYFALGGAMHDAAVSAWSIKGWYDSARPVSAVRHMATQGQSSETAAADYAVQGLPLIPGQIERIAADDPLAGAEGEHVGKLKLRAWRGPGAIDNPQTDTAGVGWTRGELWWPYQRPTFVTPPFAGYISGHSAFSRAAAEVLTLLTGDEYFPGGLAEFRAPANDFLVFEAGPSIDVVLQWATYRDASDQTSLSRIWGGIHPPVDDIAGREVGIKVGTAAFAEADRLFSGDDQPHDEVLAPEAGAGGWSLQALVLMALLGLLRRKAYLSKPNRAAARVAPARSLTSSLA